MKKNLVLFSLIALAACGNSKKTEVAESKDKPAPTANEEHHVFGVESGILELSYSSEGKTTGSKDLIYFDRWGKRMAKYVCHPETEGGEAVPSTCEIRLGDTSFILNLHDKTGMKMENMMSTQLSMGGGEFPEVAQMKTFGAAKKEPSTILGKTCDVWEMKQNDIVTQKSVYKGIILGTHVIMKGMDVITTATKFDENVPVPEDKMKIPSGIKFE